MYQSKMLANHNLPKATDVTAKYGEFAREQLAPVSEGDQRLVVPDFVLHGNQ